MHPKFYEDDFVVTTESDTLEYMRSPFYDMARTYHATAEEQERILEEIAVKNSMVRNFEHLINPPSPTKESIAYTRYADHFPERDEDARSRKEKFLFEFPRGQPYKIINAGELFRVEKTKEHLENLRRQKPLIAAKYFGPFDLKESNLISLLIEQRQVWEGEWEKEVKSEKYLEWRQHLLEAIPQLNHDVLINFALYLAFEAKLNDIKVWRAIEEASYPILHHLTIS